MKSETIKNYLNISAVIPVVVIDDPNKALSLAKALLEGGVAIMEITLRTDAALQAISIIRQKLPEMCIGAGTVNTAPLVKKAIDAGAQFLVSPGVTASILKAVKSYSIPLLPGVSTASEAMLLEEAGYPYLKFFPAEAAGGIAMLKSLAAPLASIKFCPTGGIDNTNMKDYLALKNVVCIGSSWPVAKELVINNDWRKITARAQQISLLTSK